MIYLHASAAVSQFIEDANTPAARQYFKRPGLVFIVSDLCTAEYIAAVSQHVRTRRYSPAVGKALIVAFDNWAAESAGRINLAAGDVAAATDMLRRFDVKLRTPDTLHLAICRRVGARLLSFDNDQVAAARAFGIALAQ